MAKSKNDLKKTIKIDKSDKDIAKTLKNLAKDKKDKKLDIIDARDHKIEYDFETYNNLLPNGVTIISK